MRRFLAVLAVLLVVPALAARSSPLAGDERGAPAAPTPTLQVSFKLDARLSGPTYGGERWVSPPTYRGVGGQDTVEARASAVDAAGRPLEADLEWTVSDPDRVSVSPPRGGHVKITAKRSGESVVTVKARGASRKLTVKAVETNGIRQVSISQ